MDAIPFAVSIKRSTLTDADIEALDGKEQKMPDGMSLVIGIQSHVCLLQRIEDEDINRKWQLTARVVSRVQDTDYAWDINAIAPFYNESLHEAHDKWEASITRFLLDSIKIGEFPFED
jgi:hypothetical protein